MPTEHVAQDGAQAAAELADERVDLRSGRSSGSAQIADRRSATTS